MNRFQRSKRTSGFTLIELLVVIAIIGILSTLLFPAIQGALLKTKATTAGAKMGNKGLTGVLYDVSLDRNQASLPELFPRISQYGTSTEFFNAIFTNSAVQTVMQVSTLTIPGQITPPSTHPITADQNLWNVVEGLSTSSDPGIPFMFTKNITWNTLNSEPAIANNQDGGEPILNDKLAIVVYAQGAVRVFNLDETFISRDVLSNGGSYSNNVLTP